MRIGIDARFYGITGIGRYLQNLIKHLEVVDTTNEYVIFLRQEGFETYTPQNPRFTKQLSDHPWYSVREQVYFLGDLWEAKCDLVHFAHINVPVLYLRPFVVTIHDLITHDAKKGATTRNALHFYLKKFVYLFVVWWTAVRAKAIIVPTHQVKDEVVRRLRVNPTKIHVTYEAVDDVFFSDAARIQEQDENVGNAVLRKYGVKTPYILYVSSFYPHKNHKLLIDAFELLELEGYQLDTHKLQLVLVGKHDKFLDQIAAYTANKGLGEQVIFPGKVAPGGYTPDEDLLWLMKKAMLYVCPSKIEGFGITFLEAMAMGLPVILSNASCLPEIGGDAAVYVDPDDAVALKEEIKRVLEDENVRADLIAKGAERVRQFSWRKMAEETLEVYVS